MRGIRVFLYLNFISSSENTIFTPESQIGHSFCTLRNLSIRNAILVTIKKIKRNFVFLHIRPNKYAIALLKYNNSIVMRETCALLLNFKTSTSDLTMN